MDVRSGAAIGAARLPLRQARAALEHGRLVDGDLVDARQPAGRPQGDEAAGIQADDVACAAGGEDDREVVDLAVQGGGAAPGPAVAATSAIGQDDADVDVSLDTGEGVAVGMTVPSRWGAGAAAPIVELRLGTGRRARLG